MRRPTDSEINVYNTLRLCIERNGECPSLRALAELVGMSHQAVSQHLKRLAARQCLSRGSRQQRCSWRLTTLHVSEWRRFPDPASTS